MVQGLSAGTPMGSPEKREWNCTRHRPSAGSSQHAGGERCAGSRGRWAAQHDRARRRAAQHTGVSTPRHAERARTGTIFMSIANDFSRRTTFYEEKIDRFAECCSPTRKANKVWQPECMARCMRVACALHRAESVMDHASSHPSSCIPSAALAGHRFLPPVRCENMRRESLRGVRAIGVG